jgi:hypothetical protein
MGALSRLTADDMKIAYSRITPDVRELLPMDATRFSCWVGAWFDVLSASSQMARLVDPAVTFEAITTEMLVPILQEQVHRTSQRCFTL